MTGQEIKLSVDSDSNCPPKSVSECIDAIVAEMLARRPGNGKAVLVGPELEGGGIPGGIGIVCGQGLSHTEEFIPPCRNELEHEIASHVGEYIEVEIIPGASNWGYGVVGSEHSIAGVSSPKGSQPHLHTHWYLERVPKAMADEWGEEGFPIGARAHLIGDHGTLKREGGQ